MKIIARIESDFKEKFGIPRQSCIIPELKARIVFQPEYRNPHAVMGLEEYSHIWILWQFSEAVRENWSPTVLPPRLGGKTHVGVFATRSPVLYVAGADLLDGTPIYDIKPYLAYTDSHPEAVCGFADRVKDYELKVVFPDEFLRRLPEEKREAAIEILRQDPRPPYQNDPKRRYGVAFAGYDIRFHVADGVLTVCEVVEFNGKPH